jgi:hypothetical protein
MAQRVDHREVVSQLLEAQTVDFGAIGKAFAEIGPGLSLADDPWEVFCGTMRWFIRVFIINPFPGGGPVIEDLDRLKEVSQALRS